MQPIPPDAPHRAGRYTKQLEGYSSFEPTSLPPQPPLAIDEGMARLLADATLAVGRLDGAIQILPNPDLFVLMYVRKEAVLSSQIEGTQSSLDDVLAAEANIFDSGRPNDVFEVVNYVDAMKHGLARLKDLPVSTRLITEIHAILLKRGRGKQKQPGEVRQSQNWIGPGGCTLATAAFVPPHPSTVAEHLSALERYLHTPVDHHELVRIGLAHAQFETIHPFLDGNGRAGRLLIAFLLVERGLLERPVLYISHFFKAHRDEYYRRLQAVRDAGDWEGWIAFFLRAILDVSSKATQTARDIVALRERDRAIIQDHFGARGSNALKLLDLLFQRPIVTTYSAAEHLGVTYPSARTIIRYMVEHGILTEITGHDRNQRFRYQNYVQLFR
jgi:Fic family protein